MPPSKKKSPHVLIVGAGISGLYAAKMLEEAQISFEILEASHRFGGRIFTQNSFADFPIELGAEEIHGTRSQWFKLISQQVSHFVNLEDSEDFFYLENVLQDEEEVDSHPLFPTLWEFLDHLHSYQGPDILLTDYLETCGFPPLLHPFLNAFVGNECGTSNDHIGVFSLKRMLHQWSAGEENLTLPNHSFEQILITLFQNIFPQIHYQTEMTQIDFHSTPIRITTRQGKIFEGSHVVLTVPLAILKKRKIRFVPNLPSRKQNAIQKLQMGEGIKVILKFTKPFWAPNTGSIYGTGLVPEFWVTSFGKPKVKDSILTAFINGKNALQLQGQKDQLIPTLLEELCEIFDSTLPQDHFIVAHIQDWSQEPFIGGTYSFPSPHSEPLRKFLAEPVQNKLFFAGEATHTEGHFGTVHGAIETSIRAIGELRATLNQEEKQKN